ncbi:MAG: epimerase [Gemmatimonadota bacterium]|nr:epimerase [Gemmatimonadota bacterium]
MNVVIFGATGMVGSGVLLECVDDARVESVLVVGRSSCEITHPKLREIIHRDFFDFSDIEPILASYDTCFFCLGVSAAGLSEAEYHRLTYELTMAAAETLVASNPEYTFCYVSGAGTDSTERGRFMWARVKGKTENRLLTMPFKAAFMFRPAFIQPLKGVRSKTRLYRIFYVFTGPIFPLLRRLFPPYVTTTETVGRAMIEVAATGYAKRRIENRDINTLVTAVRRPLTKAS